MAKEVPMSIKRLIVEADLSTVNVRQFCAQHGVSKSRFYELRRAYAERGEGALEAASRAPRRVANRTPDEVEDQIVRLRKDLTELGVDAGPATIQFHLGQALPEGAVCPSEATIWRILTRRGFITSEPAKAPKAAMRRFAAERANERWQFDATTWRLPERIDAKIINVIDDCTRLFIASRAFPTCTTATTWETLATGACEWGWPASGLSDNAREFRALTEPLAAIGVALHHSRPYHPQTCGKVERLHQTLKGFLAEHRPQDLAELQALLDQFRSYYNHHRPHRALARRIPAEIWHAAPKAGPATTALATTETYSAIVRADGRVNIASRYRISLGKTWAHHHVTVVITGSNAHVFADGRLIRHLTIDPTRLTQPLPTRPTRRAPR